MSALRELFIEATSLRFIYATTALVGWFGWGVRELLRRRKPRRRHPKPVRRMLFEWEQAELGPERPARVVVVDADGNPKVSS